MILAMEQKKGYKIEALLSRLSRDHYVTANEIAETLGVSEKTARTRIGELNTVLSEQGAQITSRPRYGFHLEVTDPVKWKRYLDSHSVGKDASQGSAEERVVHIALSLLLAADYIKTSDFAETLYVSPQVISEYLKECENLFSYYHLQLERKPYYGIRLIGTEFSKRNCIISCFPHEFDSFLEHGPDRKTTMKEVVEAVISTLQRCHIHLTEVCLQSTSAYVYLTVNRYLSGFQITSPTDDSEEKDRAMDAAQEILDTFVPGISQEEVRCLAVYISAMRSSMSQDIRTNIVITRKIDLLIDKIFASVKNIYKIDFSGNLRLRMMLAQHLVSMDIRIRYRIPLNNDVFLDIRKNYPYAFSLASNAVTILKQEYQADVPAAETEWLTLIFATGLRDMQMIQKMNILVVCQTGRASSQLLKYEIQRNYAEYVGSVDFCTLYELKYYNLTDIDYIFSTVNISLPVSLPILMVDDISLFSKNAAVENELMRHRLSAIDRFFRPDLFFTDLRITTKEDILKQMCEKVGEKVPLPDGFYESILEREQLHTTDYAPLVAVPHPTKLVIEKDIVAMAVLEKPVFWGRYDIQVIMMVCLALTDEEATQLFYEVTSRFMSDRKLVSQLIQDPSCSTLVGLLGYIEID